MTLLAAVLCALAFVLALAARLSGWADDREPTAMLAVSPFLLVVAPWQWEGLVVFRLARRVTEDRGRRGPARAEGL